MPGAGVTTPTRRLAGRRRPVPVPAQARHDVGGAVPRCHADYSDLPIATFQRAMPIPYSVKFDIGSTVTMSPAPERALKIWSRC